MVHRLKGRQAVYLVDVPADWKPQRLWDVPPSFSRGELYAKNLKPKEALGFARTHNKNEVQAIQAGRGTGKWAIVSKHLRPRWRNHPLQAAVQAVKGGAQ